MKAKPRAYVMVSVDANTVVIGAREVKNRLAAEIGLRGLGDEVRVVETGSFGSVSAGVVAAVMPDGIVYGHLTVGSIARLVEEHFVKGRPVREWILPGEHPLPDPETADARQLQHFGRIVLDNCGRIDPDSIDESIANDGYFALGKALTEMTPAAVIDGVKASCLRGRGGAGFPTGLKWSFCAKEVADIKYVICNADEGEPGTFKDRLIMEGDPHKVIEGMALCGYAIGATQGYIYIRGEYRLSIERMRAAIDAARRHGLLGRKILGSGFDFDIDIKIGAGAYVCGEETALIESMEGKRGLPRVKPPFPAQKGFRGKPTNVNNVETLASVPFIIHHGAEAFRAIGAAGMPGTKVYTILGHIARPGLIEVPTSVTLRDVLEDYAGGMRPGAFKMAQLGGTAGEILGPEMLDVPLNADALAKTGHTLGSGAILFMNESVGVCDFLHACIKFFAHESCGNCNPCRNGMAVLLELTARLKAGKGYPGDVELMEELVMGMKSIAFCPLGQSPAVPVLSALRYFRGEVRAGIDPDAIRPKPEHTLRTLLQLAG
ncbi:MAG: NADH-quinone oxidoreductase subunit NuoF [Lentisphaerota bacterium]